MGLTENKKGQPILISHPSISIAASYRIGANTTALLIRAALCPKVHFLSQILDYNGQILNKTAPKNAFVLLERRRSICVDTVSKCLVLLHHLD